MPFLTQEDYKAIIKDQIFAQVMGNDITVAQEAELFAQQEITSYLNQRYDCTDIFSQEGTDRNALIVMYMIDITLYHMHARINPMKIPQIRIDRYENAVKWLGMVSKGQITPGLPLITDAITGETDPDLGRGRSGSNEKFNHQW